MDTEDEPSASQAAACADVLRDQLCRIGACAAATHNKATAEREDLVRLCQLALNARREADDARAEAEHLLAQVREANGKLVMATLVAQRLADEANTAWTVAHHNEERFRALIYTSSAIVWQASADGRVQVDRDTWRKFTGIDPGQDESSWLDAVHPDDQDRVRDAWAKAVADATPYTCQHRLRSRDGGYAWVLAQAVPVPQTGTPREWIGMMTDISDRVRVEQAREQFIGILGHDLRNPLSAVLMGAELLGDLPAPYSSVVAKVAKSAHRMEAMIRDLLDFARARLAGGIPVARQPCDLRAVGNLVVEEMSQAYPERAITFQPAGDLCGDWDPSRVEQVLSNLIGNALAHGIGPVRVTGCGDGAEVVLAVHNHGRPIPAAAIPTLFAPFKRPAQPGESARGAHEGLGLGLYIASEIVHGHGGTIAVTSTERDGTTFTVRWPRHAPPPHTNAAVVSHGLNDCSPAS